MSFLSTFPSPGKLQEMVARTPEFMSPSAVPYAVCLEGALQMKECEDIVEKLDVLEPYEAHGCGAVTREISSNPVLDPIEKLARMVNESFFNFDLNPGQHSWMQTYEKDGTYQRHMDGMPGQTRKLTAVAMLTSPLEYEGGTLRMHVHPVSFDVPKTMGTVVVFQHWVEHEVLPVAQGQRRTINMGFWGPPFK